MVITDLLLQAQQLHIQNPADNAHDWMHHWSVLNNAIEIVGAEQLDVRLDILAAACVLHDFDRGDEKHQQRAKEILNKYANEDECKEIMNTIANHSFGHEQDFIEANVLYDADKLAYLNLLRHYELNIFNGYNEERSKLHDKYKKLFEDRIDHVYESLHYDYTKKRFNERMEILKNLINAGYPISTVSLSS